MTGPAEDDGQLECAVHRDPVCCGRSGGQRDAGRDLDTLADGPQFDEFDDDGGRCRSR